MSEETPQVSEAVAVAAGMTADDLISQWTEQVDTKEKDDEIVEEARGEAAVDAEPTDEIEREAEAGDDVRVSTGDEHDATRVPDATVEGGSGGNRLRDDAAGVGAEAGSAGKVQEAAQPAVPQAADPSPIPDLDKLIEETDLFDPDQSKKLLKTLADVVKSQQDVIEQSRSVAKAAEVENYWKSYAAKNPEIGDTARKMWDESIKKHTERGLTGEKLQAAATAEWEVRIELAKTTARAPKPDAPKAPQPKVTPGATRVTPQPTRTKPPYTPRRAEDKLAAGMYGDLTSIIDT